MSQYYAKNIHTVTDHLVLETGNTISGTLHSKDNVNGALSAEQWRNE